MQSPPAWLPEAELPLLCTDAAHRSWLQERGSLTARLHAHWGDVAVHVLEESLAVPLPHEARRLDMDPDALAWVRCVQLVCQGQPRVYARTVIPGWGPQNPWVQVQGLGQQPLGELLFHLPDLRRSAFEWARGLMPHWPEALARRCVFERTAAPLLLTEVFLSLKQPPQTDRLEPDA